MHSKVIRSVPEATEANLKSFEDYQRTPKITRRLPKISENLRRLPKINRRFWNVFRRIANIFGNLQNIFSPALRVIQFLCKSFRVYN